VVPVILLILPNIAGNKIFPSDVMDEVILLITIVFLVPLCATGIYSSCKQKESTWNLIKELFANLLMYACGVVTIYYFYVIVQYTGGLQDSLLSFYFFFIPSAIAISFRGYIGMTIATIVCIYFLYILFFDSVLPTYTLSGEQEYTKLRFWGYAYQIGAIFILEMGKNAKVVDKIMKAIK
jgi:hypothetical protein